MHNNSQESSNMDLTQEVSKDVTAHVRPLSIQLYSGVLRIHDSNRESSGVVIKLKRPLSIQLYSRGLQVPALLLHALIDNVPCQPASRWG